MRVGGNVMTISEKIFDFMSEKNISQKEFAERTGISQSTISDWKRKGTNPAADKIMVICDALDISVYDLLNEGQGERFRQLDYMIIHKDSEEYIGNLTECKYDTSDMEFSHMETYEILTLHFLKI